MPTNIARPFEGREAVVTAGATGIGLAIARELVDGGATVVIVDQDAGALEKAIRLSDGLRPLCGRISADSAEGLATEVLRIAPATSLIVNGVGVNSGLSYMELERETLEATISANVIGAWFFTRHIAQDMKRSSSRAGAVLFVSSLHQHFTRGNPDYSTSKAAVAMLVREMARELAPDIRVNSVSPGAVNLHDQGSTIGERDESRARRLLPLARLGRPIDVARMATVLLSDYWSGYVTGADFRVDGGLSLHTWLDDLYDSAADERTQNTT